MARVLRRVGTSTAPGARVLLTALLLVLAALIAGCGDDGEQAPATSTESVRPIPDPAEDGPDRPNVVVVMTDDQRADSISLMPKLSRTLVAKGTTFTNAHATTPQCCPSRASFLTGRYAHNHRVRENLAPQGGYSKLRSDRTLPVWLQRAGYRTGMIGRYLNEYGNSATGGDPLEIPPGWDDWHVPVEHTEFQNYGFTLNENGELNTYGDDPEDYSTDVYARKARSFVADAAPSPDPFFLWVATHTPHFEGVLEKGDPGNPRPAARHEGEFRDVELPDDPSINEADVADKPERIQRRPLLTPDELEQLRRTHASRLASLLAVDDLVGGLVRELRRAGELKQTIFVFTSDHGFIVGEHRLRGKSEIYDPSTRIPIVISGPGFGAGTEEDTLAANIDLAPTFVAAADAETDFVLDGMPLQENARDQLAARPGVALEHFSRPRFRGVRTDRWTFGVTVPGDRELYDNREDPSQLENLAGAQRYADREAALEELSGQLSECQGSACWQLDR